MNDMRDLREEVATRMRDAMHGKEIDYYGKEAGYSQMLGIVEFGEKSTPEKEEGTLLDPDHEFWQEWHEDYMTGYSVKKTIQTAIRSLKDDGILRVTFPYDTDSREAETAYVEVDKLTDSTESVMMDVKCSECGEMTDAAVSIKLKEEVGYNLKMALSCNSCGESGVYSIGFRRQ